MDQTPTHVCKKALGGSMASYSISIARPTRDICCHTSRKQQKRGGYKTNDNVTFFLCVKFQPSSQNTKYTGSVIYSAKTFCWRSYWCIVSKRTFRVLITSMNQARNFRRCAASTTKTTAIKDVVFKVARQRTANQASKLQPPTHVVFVA